MGSPQQRHRIQEDQYDFPYHHLPQWGRAGFRQARHLDWGFEMASYVSYLIERLETIPFQRLLDVGCGDGRFLTELSRTQSGKELVGIDISERAIRMAQTLTPDVRWVAGNVTDSPPLDGLFDVVTLIETLEHIPPEGIAAFVEGLERCLAADGVLVLTVPSKNLPLQDKHFQHFDEQTLRDALRPCFEVERIDWVNRQVKYVTRVYRRLLSNSWFILNHPGALHALYRFYVRQWLSATERNGTRLVAVCRKARG